MPISLSGLRSAAGGALSGIGHGGSSKGSMVIRNGRAYKLVPAGAKMQKRKKSSGHRTSSREKLIEYALISSMMRH